jgi:ribosomal protein S19E (S16A)
MALMNAATPLSTSEKQTLRYVAEGEVHPRELDWLALQRLKQIGFVQDHSAWPRMTAEGRRALQQLLATA